MFIRGDLPRGQSDLVYFVAENNSMNSTHEGQAQYEGQVPSNGTEGEFEPVFKLKLSRKSQGPNFSPLD